MSIILRSTRQWGRLVWRVSRGQSKVTVQLDNILIREYITQRLTRKLSQSYIFQGNLAHYFLFCKFPELFLLDCQASLYITNSQSLLKLMFITRWCHSTISPSVVPFSYHLQSFPASGSFQMSQFFTSGGRSIGVSASASVFPVNTQDWSPLGLTGLMSLQSKGLSGVFSNTTVQKHQFFGAQLPL